MLLTLTGESLAQMYVAVCYSLLQCVAACVFCDGVYIYIYLYVYVYMYTYVCLWYARNFRKTCVTLVTVTPTAQSPEWMCVAVWCSVLQCIAVWVCWDGEYTHINVYMFMCMKHNENSEDLRHFSAGWRWPIGCLTLQVIFHERATKYDSFAENDSDSVLSKTVNFPGTREGNVHNSNESAGSWSLRELREAHLGKHRRCTEW